MKNQKLIVGNWKMNPQTEKEAVIIIKGIKKTLSTLKRAQAVVCAPTLYFETIKKTLGKSKAQVGVQNISSEEKGSYTGEISAGMAKSVGAKYSIIGHSERRKMGETDEIVNKKTLQALASGLIPIICIGETTRDEEGLYLSVIKTQIEKALKSVLKEQLSKIVIAYEPVWAIGAAAAMGVHEIHQMTIFIKKTLADMYRLKMPIDVTILYGGAVDPTNAHGILYQGEADGLLIGRQSLDPQAFSEILTLANTK